MDDEKGADPNAPKCIDEPLSAGDGQAEADRPDAVDGFGAMLDAELDECEGPQDTAGAVGRVLPVIAETPDALARDLMLQQLARRTKLGIHKLRQQLPNAATAAPEGEAGKKTGHGGRAGNADDWLSLDVARAFGALMAQDPQTRFETMTTPWPPWWRAYRRRTRSSSTAA